MRSLDEEYREWISRKPCIICGNGTYHEDTGEWLTDPAHVKSHGSGGRIYGNLVPLKREYHVESHKIGWPAFQDKYGVDIHTEAKKLMFEFQAMKAIEKMNEPDTESVKET